MNLRSALFASIFAAGLALAGCSNDPCQAEANAVESKYGECGREIPDTSGGGDTTVACEGSIATQAECRTKCHQDVTCPALNGEDSDGATAYQKCQTDCLAVP
jgi:hypothetical protein